MNVITYQLAKMRQIAALQVEVFPLQKEVIRLGKEIERPKEENDRLESENAEMCRHTNKHSHNSHKPLSNDGYGKNPHRSSTMLKEKKHKHGGQVGNKGRTLRQVRQPDGTQVHFPRQCTICGRAISASEKYRVVSSRNRSALTYEF